MGGTPTPIHGKSAKIINLIFEPFHWISDIPDLLEIPDLTDWLTDKDLPWDAYYAYKIQTCWDSFLPLVKICFVHYGQQQLMLNSNADLRMVHTGEDHLM